AVAHLVLLLENVEAGDGRSPAAWREKGGQHSQSGCLACTVRPEEPEDLSGLHSHVDSRDRLDCAISRLEDTTEPMSLDRLGFHRDILAGSGRRYAFHRIMASTFRGWPEEFQRFFIGLELENSKRYFEANRRVYEEMVKAPMVALLASL